MTADCINQILITLITPSLGRIAIELERSESYYYLVLETNTLQYILQQKAVSDVVSVKRVLQISPTTPQNTPRRQRFSFIYSASPVLKERKNFSSDDMCDVKFNKNVILENKETTGTVVGVRTINTSMSGSKETTLRL